MALLFVVQCVDPAPKVATAETDQDEGQLSELVRGRYARTQVQSCVNSAAGFDANLVPLSNPTYNVTTQVGTLTLDGSGNLDLILRATTITVTAQPPSIPVSVTDAHCTGTYDVGTDRIITTASTCQLQTVAGAGMGNTSLLTRADGSPLTYRLRYLPNPRTIVPAPPAAGGTATPTIEKIAGQTPTGVTFAIYRICSRTSWTTEMVGHAF
jgi:hypothetical protein